MKALVLAATHKRLLNSNAVPVPLPLLDVPDNTQNPRPYLTILLDRLDAIRGMDYITIVTNHAIMTELEMWAKDITGLRIPFRIISDGTRTMEDRKGAVGDIIFALREANINDDVLIIGGDNWFTYDISRFIITAKKTPALVATRIARVTQPNRFGWVQIDADKRITNFLEKPDYQPPSSFLKASCVYYVSKNDLAWFETFAEEHSTVCSPGTFFAWLAERSPVYGIEIASSWYDMGRTDPSQLSGADFILFRDIVRHHVHPAYSTWQRNAARKLQFATNHKDLIDALQDRDVNVRIVASLILGRSGALMSESVKKFVVEELLQTLDDPAENGISDEWEGDEGEAYFVSATAAESLVILGYAENVSAVFEKARQEGRRVQEKRNLPA